MDKNTFYESKQWKATRRYIRTKYLGTCQRCHKAGSIVHHIIPLDESNVNDPSIALNEANLILLCQTCHNLIHENSKYLREDVQFNSKGELVEAPSQSFLKPKPTSTDVASLTLSTAHS